MTQGRNVAYRYGDRVRLGLNLGYWGTGHDMDSPADNLALARRADELGYSVVWAAEAYGSDAPTVLSFVAAQTSNVDLGAAVMQIPARSPAMTAMTAATLDALSGGRFRLGLGVSGPQVSEGWHGVRFDRPLGRTREYVDVVRLALAHERVRYDGTHYVLPLPDGPGKALTLTVHPVRPQLPIYLAAVGPRNLELAGEIADGWLAIFFSAAMAEEQLRHVRAGRERGRRSGDFDVAASMSIVVGQDVSRCAEPVRPTAALYVGGMGSRRSNYYHALATRMGYGRAADLCQQRYLDRDYAGAAAALPLDFIDATSLLGPVPRIAERMAELSAAGVTTLSVSPKAATPAERLQAVEDAAQALSRSSVPV